ncbi:hypothetical protein ACOSQ3_031109 [Xanthoceras sorbifolium]
MLASALLHSKIFKTSSQWFTNRSLFVNNYKQLYNSQQKRKNQTFLPSINLQQQIKATIKLLPPIYTPYSRLQEDRLKKQHKSMPEAIDTAENKLFQQFTLFKLLSQTKINNLHTKKKKPKTVNLLISR